MISSMVPACLSRRFGFEGVEDRLAGEKGRYSKFVKGRTMHHKPNYVILSPPQLAYQFPVYIPVPAWCLQLDGVAENLIVIVTIQ